MPSVIDVIGMVIGLVIVQSWKEIVTRQGVILVLALVQEGTGHELQKRKKIANQVAVALVNLPVAALLQERIVVEV